MFINTTINLEPGAINEAHGTFRPMDANSVVLLVADVCDDDLMEYGGVCKAGIKRFVFPEKEAA